MALDWVRLQPSPPSEPLEQAPRIRPPADVGVPRACFGSAPIFNAGHSGEPPSHPSVTIQWPDDCPDDAPQESTIFTTDWTPFTLRDGPCEEPLPIPTYNEVFRQFRVQRIRNQEDAEQYVDVEEALTSIFNGPEGKQVRFIWAQQPPADEVISEGSRGTEPEEDA